MDENEQKEELQYHKAKSKKIGDVRFEFVISYLFKKYSKFCDARNFRMQSQEINQKRN